jgi:hypothetical protein
MKHILIILLTFISLFSTAQKNIDIEDASNYVNDSVIVCSKIYGGKFLEILKGSPTFLDVGAEYPNALLTLVIWGDVRKKFHQAPELLFNKDVCIYGVIEMYKGKPEIVIKNENQILQAIRKDVH